jgi:hypothetical protein
MKMGNQELPEWAMDVSEKSSEDVLRKLNPVAARSI